MLPMTLILSCRFSCTGPAHTEEKSNWSTSVWTISTFSKPPSSSWRTPTRIRSNSTATTRRAVRAIMAVRTPMPEPISTTVSVSRTPAIRTIFSRMFGSQRKHWPSRLRGRIPCLRRRLRGLDIAVSQIHDSGTADEIRRYGEQTGQNQPSDHQRVKDVQADLQDRPDIVVREGERVGVQAQHEDTEFVFRKVEKGNRERV